MQLTYEKDFKSQREDGRFVSHMAVHMEKMRHYKPILALPEQTNYPIGKYGNLRLDFMKKHRRGTYTTIITEGRVNEYLHAIDIQARLQAL